jgi:hypothetical protein
VIFGEVMGEFITPPYVTVHIWHYKSICSSKKAINFEINSQNGISYIWANVLNTKKKKKKKKKKF